MGSVVTKVPLSYNADGTVNKMVNLLSQYQQMTLTHLQQAAAIWYNVPLTPGEYPRGAFHHAYS